jgi:hypothetical protein
MRFKFAILFAVVSALGVVPSAQAGPKETARVLQSVSVRERPGDRALRSLASDRRAETALLLPMGTGPGDLLVYNLSGVADATPARYKEDSQ